MNTDLPEYLRPSLVILHAMALLRNESLRCGNRGTVRRSDLKRMVNKMQSSIDFDSALSELEDAEVIVRANTNIAAGRSLTLLDTRRVSPTLADLMIHAERCVDPEKEPEPGRRSRAEKRGREVWNVSPKQYERMVTAANTLAAGLNPDRRSGLVREKLWALVDDPTLFRHDPLADGTSGWTAMRAAFGRVMRGRSQSQLRTHLGIIELLLDLGTTHGIIHRDELTDALSIPTSPGWREFDQAWSEILNCKTLGSGWGTATKTFFDAAIKVLGHGESAPLTVLKDDPDVLLAELSDRYSQHSFSSNERHAIRKMLRSAEAAGLLPAGCVDDDFDLRNDRGVNAFPGAVAIEIANAQFAERLDRNAAWSRLPFRALADAENSLSLRSAVDYFTLEGVVDRLNLPKFGKFPRPEHPRNAMEQPPKWARPRTVDSKIRRIGVFVGIVTHYRPGLDIQSLDLRDLFTIEHLSLLARALDDGLYSADHLSRVATDIGLIASPYCETRAVESGDMELADQFLEVSSYASGHGLRAPAPSGDGVVLKSEPLSELLAVEAARNRKERGDRPRARELEDAWAAASDALYAYVGMVGVLEHGQREFLERVGAAYWSQVAVYELTRPQLMEVQSLALWQEQLRLPLRAHTLEQVTIDERTTVAGRSGEESRWDIPASKLKCGERGESDRDLGAVVWRAAEDEEDFYDRGLWDFYIDDIRPALLAGDSSDRVWVIDMRRGSSKTPAVDGAALNRRLRKALRLGSEALNPEAIDDVHRICTTHYCRHALGGYYVNELKDPFTAATLLHHSSTEMVERIYSTRTRHASAVGAVHREPASNGVRDTPTLPEDVLEAIRDNPDLLAEVIQAIREAA